MHIVAPETVRIPSEVRHKGKVARSASGRGPPCLCKICRMKVLWTQLILVKANISSLMSHYQAELQIRNLQHRTKKDPQLATPAPDRNFQRNQGMQDLKCEHCRIALRPNRDDRHYGTVIQGPIIRALEARGTPQALKIF